MSRYRLVIFDFDGTLADSFSWALQTMGPLADRYRFRKIAPEQIERLRGCDSRALMRELGVSLWKVPWIAAELRRRMAAEIDAIALFPGIGDLLRELARAKVEMAIVTSNAFENVCRVLGPELAGVFGQLSCGASLFGKARRFKQVVRRSRLPSETVLCVGDELRDLQAARAIGLRAGAVSWGYASPALLRAHQPDELFETVDALWKRLLPER